jgi:folate-binding protein YgfZ
VTDLAALAREECVVVPASDRGTLRVTGSDRLSWLEGLVTPELKSLRSGLGTWGLVLNRQGKIQSVLWIAAADDALWLSVAPGTVTEAEAQLSRMLIMEDAELEAPSSEQVWFALHGPQAVPRAAEMARTLAGFSAAIDWLGIGGAALLVPRDSAEQVVALSRDRLLSVADWTALRLERGLPEFGIDFDQNDRPHEAALERRAVSWTKGCYLGQEVVCMQDMRGKVKRSVRVLRVAAPRDAGLIAGASILDAADQPIGSVTSAAFSERAGEWLVMGQLKLEGLTGTLSYASDGVRWPARPSEIF